MNKYILMILVALLPISSSFAQTHQDSIDTYNELNKWAVVKLTIAYIEDYKQWTPETESGKLEQEFNTYKKLNNDYSDFKEDIVLDEVGGFLTNGDWSKARKQVFDKYRTDLVDNTSFSDFEYVELFTEGLSINTSSENILKEIKTKYSEILNPSTVTENNDIEEDRSPESDVTSNYANRHANSRNKGNNTLLYLIGGTLFLSIVVNIFLFYKKNTLEKKKELLKKDLKSAKDQYNSLFTQKHNNNSTNRRSETSNEFQNLKIENQNLKRELSVFKKTDDNKTISNSNIPSTVEINTPIPAHTNRVIYLASPFQDSTFADEDASSVKTQNTIYQVDFDERTKTGVLSLIQDADFSKALNSPDSYLETACIYDNEYNNNSREIRVSEKGEIRLEGEDWIVTKKVRIKFI